MTYRVVRFFQNARSYIVKRGLTLKQAQAHCGDPQTSSNTATSQSGRRRTRRYGSWFDGYTKEGK